MKLKGNAYFLIVILVLTLVIIIQSFRMEYLSSRLLPLIIGGIVFILAAIGLVQEMVAEHKPKAAETGDETGGEKKAKEGFRDHLPIIIWILGYALGIYLLGFIISIPVFIIAYIKSHGRRWLTAIVSAVLAIAIIYGVFEFLLRVELYRGLFFTLLDR